MIARTGFNAVIFGGLVFGLGYAAPWQLARCVAAASPRGAQEISTVPTPAPDGLTLDEAVRIALSTNPELRGSRAGVNAAKGRAVQAGLWANPELEFTVEEWRVRGSGSGFSNAKQLIGVAQTTPFPGKKPLDRRIGAAAVRVSSAELAVRRLQLVRDVKIAFYQVLAAERLTDVERELVKVAEASATTARKRVEAGAAPDQEQLRADIPLDQARSELAGFESDLAIARQTLAALLGRPDLMTTEVSGMLSETADLSLLDRGPEQWLAAHPSVLSARSSVDRAGLEWRRAKLEPYPDVTFGVAGGREGSSDNSALVEFRVSLPVPIIDRSKGRKQEARANAEIAEADAAAVEQALLREWHGASQRFRTAAEQVTNYRERILPKVNEALRLVTAGFEEGKFGFIDLIDTQRTTAEARLAYQRKLLDLNVARAELESFFNQNNDSP